MTFDLVSPLPVQECIRRLRAATDGGLSIAGTKPVLGTVGERSIRLRQRTLYRHTAQVWLSGDFSEDGGETRLHCRLGMHPYFRTFLKYWTAVVMVVAGTFFVHAARVWLTEPEAVSPHLWIGIVLPLLLCGFGVVLLKFGDQIPGEEPRFLIEFLERTIQAREA